MSNIFSLGALPVGFLMFFGMAFAFVKRRVTHRAASKEFPELAQRLGLTHKPSPYRGGIGTLSGTFQGYRVFIDPDEQRKVSLYFEGTPGVFLRSYVVNQRPPDELSRLYSGDRRFDAFFKTRYADDGVAQRIQEYTEWRPLIAVLEDEFRRELTQFNVSETSITLVINFGNPPHIPSGAVERLLEVLVRFATVIDPPDPSASASASASANSSA